MSGRAFSIAVMLSVLAAARGANSQQAGTVASGAPASSAVVRVVPLPTVPGEDAPRNRVELVLRGHGTERVEVLARSLIGACTAVQDAPRHLEIRCWWAGAGDQFEVRVERARLVVRIREVGEGGDGPWRQHAVPFVVTRVDPEMPAP